MKFFGKGEDDTPKVEEEYKVATEKQIEAAKELRWAALGGGGRNTSDDFLEAAGLKEPSKDE
jgi:hypothetical protein